MNDWLLYGATGYTGSLIARLAAERGMRPVLAGRDAAKLAAVAPGLPTRAFGLDAIDLAGVSAVLHCAGPFSATSRPMADACLARGVHYLDITGEIGVFEALARRSAEAAAAGVMLMPGVGFDV
ncbi:MAG: saccharopine dehydrogenase NADP-binding domain-containing protein, partial [Gemmataceae bacterium]